MGSLFSLNEQAKLRIDKWLWFARIVKTRSLAAKLVQNGKVRINRNKITAASQSVKPGDVLTFSIHDRIRVLKVAALGERRGPAVEAQQLYEDLSPKPDKKDPSRIPVATPSPEKRPDKRARRQIQSFKNNLAGEIDGSDCDN